MLIELTRGKHAIIDVIDISAITRFMRPAAKVTNVLPYIRRYNLRLVDHRRNTRNRQHITKASQEHKQLCLMLFS